MNPVDVHPEDLLDKAIERRLSSEERRRLEQHAAHCHACGIEWRAVNDFAAQRKLSHADEESIARILNRVSYDVGLVATEQLARAQPSPGRKRTRFLAYAAAAAVLFVAAGAAAVFQAYRREAPTALPASTTQAVANVAPAKVEPVKPRELVEVAPPAPAEVRAKPRTLVEKPASEAQDTAAEMFSRANEARRRGDYSQALKGYAELQQHHPGSPEELTSRVAVGRLLLDRLKDPAGALRAFDRYLAKRGAGALAEEARVGRALALTSLGRRAEARKAWQLILQKHPNSVHAERARKRLQEL